MSGRPQRPAGRKTRPALSVRRWAVRPPQRPGMPSCGPGPALSGSKPWKAKPALVKVWPPSKLRRQGLTATVL